MKAFFKNIPESFPVNTLIRIAWFSTLSFTGLIFLMTWVDRGNLQSAAILRFIDFVLIFLINMLAIIIEFHAIRFHFRGIKLAALSFILVACSGTLLVILNDLLIHFLESKHIVILEKPVLPQAKLYISAFLRSALVSYLVVTWQVFVLSQNERMTMKVENAALKAAHTHAFNQLLLQQIHPHFLFNALATIKSLIRKHPDLAADYIVKLSQFLRASISAVKENSTTLEQELNFCTDYLHLQQVRLGKALYFTIEVDPKLKLPGLLPVFALQSLAENAIKHNRFSELEPMHIEIKLCNELLTVKNNYRPNHNQKESTGTGLFNLSERYHSMTGEKIMVRHDETHFYVSLKLVTL